jgi:hypothetical protein
MEDALGLRQARLESNGSDTPPRNKIEKFEPNRTKHRLFERGPGLW